MDAVKVWCFSVCVALVIAAIVLMIVPSIDKQKIMRLIISAFILAGVLSPMLTVVDEIDVSLDYSDYLSDLEKTELDSLTLANLEDNVANAVFPLVKEQLSLLNIQNEFGIKVALSREKEGIKLEYVNISLWDLHKIDQDVLEQKLIESLGLPISIDVT